MQRTTSLVRFTVIAAVLESAVLQAATFTIADGDVAGFKAAVLAANWTVEADTIVLAAGGDYAFSTHHPTSNPLDRTALPTITSSILIEGNGAVIRRAESAAGKFRLVRVSASGTLTLRMATVRNGDLDAVNGDWSDANGSGLRNDAGEITVEKCRFDHHHSSHWAAAIYTTGPAVVTDSRFIDNTTLDGTGAIRASNTSSIVIERCHFFGNTGDDTIRIQGVDEAEISQCSVVKAGSGGANFGRGIAVSDSILRVTNCTITDGSSSGLHISDSLVTVTHCTITEHGQANRPGIGINVADGYLILRNTLLASNNNGLPGSADCKVGSNGVLLQNLGNLIEDGSCSPAFSGDPKLGSLGYYGGKTQVFPLLQGSPALNHGHDPASVPIDQRGVARPLGAHCDIGAYEGSVRETRIRPRIQVEVLYNPEPYIIICDPLDGIIAVTVAGTRALPARSIDPGSLTMGNSRTGTARVTGIRDVNRDGIEDLSVAFRVADVYRGAFHCDDVTLVELQGETQWGQPIVGYVNVAAAHR